MRSLTPLLRVRDLKRTRRFYVDVLGFRECWVSPESGDPDTCRVENGAVGLMFSTGDNLGTTPALSGTLYIETEEVEALWESWRERVEVEWPLERMDYGTLEFGIRDPDGYILAFSRVPAAAIG